MTIRSTVAANRTGFVGRGAELSQLERLVVDGASLIAIVAPPGMGKTRLARAYATRHRRRFPGGVLVCELSDVRTPDELCAQVGIALDTSLAAATAGDAVVAEVGRALASRGRCLLILDTFEHLVAHASGVVETWREAAREAVLLITTRERLRLPAEHCLYVEALGVPAEHERDPLRIADADAVKLFVERARAARPGFALRPAEANTIRDIVRALEGIPLAIELAAARVGVLGLDQLERRLPHTADTLANLDRKASPRQATLRQAIQWSWDLLPDDERDALAAASAFRGGFGLEAAEAVIGDDALRLLTELHEKSLLVVTEVAPPSPNESRFALYGPVARFAADALAASGRREALEERHAAWFAAAPRAWESSGEIDPVARATLEKDNLFACAERSLARGGSLHVARALEALVGLEPAITAHGPSGNFIWQLDQALGRSEIADVERATVARALTTRGRLRQTRGEFGASIADFAQALALATDCGATQLAAIAQVHLGVAKLFHGDLDGAEEHFERARGDVAGLDDPRVRSLFCTHYGRYLTARGRIPEARDQYEQALSIHRRLRDRRQELRLLVYMGHQALEYDALPEAQDRYARALDLARALDDRRLEGIALLGLGKVERDLGKHPEARSHLQQALAVHRQGRFAIWEARAQAELGELALEQGKYDRACKHFEACWASIEDGAEDRFTAVGLAMHAAAEALLGRVHDAERRLARATALVSRVGSPEDAAAVELLHAELDIARARRAALARDSATAARHRLEAKTRHDRAAKEPSGRAGRFAARLLSRQLAAERPPSEAAERGAARSAPWVLHRDGSAFRAPDGSTVEIGGRKTLRRLLGALIAQRESSPGRPVAVDALVAVGWPGRRLGAISGVNRVRLALSTLRRLGLRDLIAHADDGYLLRSDVAIELTEASPNEPPPDPASDSGEDGDGDGDA